MFSIDHRIGETNFFSPSISQFTAQTKTNESIKTQSSKAVLSLFKNQKMCFIFPRYTLFGSKYLQKLKTIKRKTSFKGAEKKLLQFQS